MFHGKPAVTAAEMKHYLSEHVFLVIPEGRSISCDVLKVYEDRACVMETNCDDWPFSYAEIRLDTISYVLPAADVYDQLEHEHAPADPGEFKIAGRPEYLGELEMSFGAPDLFGVLRAWLNDEDMLGRPLTAKKWKKLQKKAVRNLDLRGLLPEPDAEEAS